MPQSLKSQSHPQITSPSKDTSHQKLSAFSRTQQKKKVTFANELETLYDPSKPDVIPLEPNQAKVESALLSKPFHLSSHKIHKLFGGRKLKDYGKLAKLGLGLVVTNDEDAHLTIGNLTSKKQCR